MKVKKFNKSQLS